MADTIYKLPLDEHTDTDLITWINSLPRNKKAEVVRHALRFYKSYLKDGETFIMPNELSNIDSGTRTTDSDIATNKVNNPKSNRKPVGLRGLTDVDPK